MDSGKRKDLQLIAQDIRILGLNMVREARSGHIGGAFSLSEIMALLYFEKMNIDPSRPHWDDRDWLVMSKGHGTVALYPTLAMRGFFPIERLKDFRKIGKHLSGHVEMHYVPGVDMSTGSLGQGFSVAVGMAYGARIAGKSFRTYAILGDGEIQEGQIWEAAMFAASAKLDNLVAILDYNKVQLDGTVVEVQNSGSPEDKFAGFGFHVLSVDGHSIQELSDALEEACKTKGKPTIIIANTIKGKGVSFMEGKSAWHGKTPTEEQFDLAFMELKEQRNKMEAIYG